MTPTWAAPDDCERECARLAQAFVTCLDGGRYAMVADLFVPDGVLHRVSGEILRGRARIANGLRRPDDQIVIHHASPAYIERIGEDEATGTSSFLAFATTTEDETAVTRVAAIWHDRYRRVEGRWLISERRIDVRFGGLSG